MKYTLERLMYIFCSEITMVNWIMAPLQKMPKSKSLEAWFLVSYMEKILCSYNEIF